MRPKAKVNEYLIFEGKHDGIIPEEMFDRAKEIRGKRHRTKRDLTLKNPFSGIMYCKCGSKIGKIPFFNPSILVSSISTQYTLFPILEKQAPVTRPTYPVPITVKFIINPHVKK